MITYTIPGRGIYNIENIVFDFNGTIAVDGKITAKVKSLILCLKEKFNIYILTADTQKTVTRQCKDLDISIKIFSDEQTAAGKRKIIEQLGIYKTICIGNGYNDIEMFKLAALSIAIIGKEGCCGQLLSEADIVAAEIEDAFEILLNQKRLIATLRG